MNMNTNPKPPLEAARKFLRAYIAESGSLDEVRSEIRQMLNLNPRNILAGLNALESLLADPPAEKGTLSYLVAVDANWPLDDPSDAGAMIWMRELVATIRDTLGDQQPPPLAG
jgi:hypothetical protein